MNQTPVGKMYLKPSRKGITLFEGEAKELDNKVEGPGALRIHQYMGLELFWEYEKDDALLVLLMQERSQISSPILRIPLTEQEVQLIEGYREGGGWWYYDLKMEENDDQAIVQVSFINAKEEETTLLWILNKRRRAIVRRSMDYFVGLKDPIFGD